MARLTSALVGIGIVVIAIAAGPSAATFSGKNGRISFARSVGNHTEIFSANPDGSHKTRLTASKPRGATSFISDWSPDGQLIAFDSDRTDVDGRKHPVQIYVMAWNGTGVTQLTRGGGFHGFPGWSPNGTTMAIDSDWGKRSLNGIWIIPASDPDGVTVAEAQRVQSLQVIPEFEIGDLPRQRRRHRPRAADQLPPERLPPRRLAGRATDHVRLGR